MKHIGVKSVRRLGVWGMLSGMVVSLFVSVVALGYAADGAQSYGAKTPIDRGTIVRTDSKDKQYVVAATQADGSNILGVVIDRSQLPMVASGDFENETFVASSGTQQVLVSTQGGDIASGDYLALSAVHGVAMKASTNEKTVIGRAAGSFTGDTGVLSTTALKDSEGKDKTVKIGLVPMTIDVKKNPDEKSTKARVPEVLERIGQAIAEKEVSPIRIYLSLGITAVSLIAAIAVVYSGVRNSVISIGRNPMSKKSIFRALLEIILTSILILVVGLFAVYLLLKL